MELFPEKSQSPLFFEVMASSQGYRAVAGIDEAGRVLFDLGLVV